MYGCESWKAGHWRIHAFILWCWRILLRDPWAARRSNQSILKEINPEYSLEGLILKLKLQYFAPDAKSWLTGKDSDAGKDWRQKERGETEDEMVGWPHQRSRLSLNKLQETDSEGQGSLLCCCMKSQRAGHEWVTEQQQKHRWGGSGVHHFPTQTLRGSALIALLA